MLRRLKSYRLANNSEIANPSVSDFFEKEGTKVYKESIETSTKDACSSFKIHIEGVSILSFINFIPLFRMRNLAIT